MKKTNKKTPKKTNPQNPQHFLLSCSSAIRVGVRPLPKLHANFLILGIVSVEEMKLGSVRKAFLETTLLFIKAEKEATVAKDKAFLQSE